MIHKNSLFSILAIICSSVFLLSCHKEYDPVYNETPDERLKKTLDVYNTLLLSAQYGWKGKLETKLGPVFFYYFDFNEDGKVNMLSDFNQATAGTPKEGTWVVKAFQRPTLSFDTYSYIHLPADPNGNINGGPTGAGLLSDFQFAITKAAGDSIVLEGIQNQSKIILKKVAQPEAAMLTNGNIKNMLQYVAINKNLRLILPDNKTIPLTVNMLSKNIASQYLTADGSDVQEFNTAFIFSPSGISLNSTFHITGFSFKEIQWDEDKQEFYVDENRRIINDNTILILNPTITLSSLLGSRYSFFQLPENTDINPLPAQSDDFIAAYSQAKESMLAGEYKLTLRDINFVFEPLTHTMLIDVYITQNSRLFLCQYNYSYSLSDAGIFKFSFNDANDSGWAIHGDMSGILNYIDNDTFRMKYIGGGDHLLGGLFSEENINFTFTGYLAK